MPIVKKYINDPKINIFSSLNSNMPLLTVAVRLRKNDIVKLMLDNGYDISINNQSPLRTAILDDNYDMVNLLLKYDADPTIKFGLLSPYDTALHKARKFRNYDIVNLLKKYM